MSHIDFFKTINMIFTKEPKPPKSLNLLLDPEDKNNENVNLYDILMNVYLNGMNTLFGSEINVGNITKEQFDTLNIYMASLGYYTNCERITNELNVTTHIEISFVEYNNQQL